MSGDSQFGFIKEHGTIEALEAFDNVRSLLERRQEIDIDVS